MQDIFVALGSNLGNRQKTLARALEAMDSHEAIIVVRASSLYETAPVGGPPQDFFLNAVVELDSTLTPTELMTALQEIERTFDRKRGVRWGPRTLDLDIILCGTSVVENPSLEIPHPRMAERSFVLAPLAEIAGEFIHPVQHKTIAELLYELPSVEGDVRRLDISWTQY